MRKVFTFILFNSVFLASAFLQPALEAYNHSCRGAMGWVGGANVPHTTWSFEEMKRMETSFLHRRLTVSLLEGRHMKDIHGVIVGVGQRSTRDGPFRIQVRFDSGEIRWIDMSMSQLNQAAGQ